MTRPKFLVDTMLGRLCRWLKILGFDAAFVAVSQRKRMLERSFLERRVLITREAKLANAHAYKLVILRDQHWEDQLSILWKTLELGPAPRAKIFSRCGGCNLPIKKIPKSKIEPKKIPEKVLACQEDFFTCPKCEKIFWEGSHVDNTLKRLKEIGIPIE